MCKRHRWHILCEEGGHGTSTHYHLHGIVESNYKRSNNFRRYVVHKVYESVGKKCTARSCVIRTVSDLSGALSYCYKDQKVVCHSGFILSRIRPYRRANSKLSKTVIRVTRSNFFSLVVGHIEQTGKDVEMYDDMRCVISEMMDEGYSFDVGNWTRYSNDSL